MSLAVGDTVPPFDLPAAPEGRAALDPQAAPATVVVFTCNHCPYALAWHERIAAVARDYAAHGVLVLNVNSNDAERYPRDSFAAMADRVRGAPDSWPMAYLHDESQEVARAFGAQTTPDVFVVDGVGRLAYRGAPDGDWEDESAGAAWLREALDDLIAGRPVARAQTTPVGCSVKWR